MVTHQLQVERRTGKVRQPETDILPLSHATKGDPGRISRRSLVQKTRVPGLSCGVVCVILRFAVLVEHRLVTDTDGRTQAHG